MFLPKHNNIVTRERMVNSRWIWGNTEIGVFTTSFYFGDDGLIKVFRNPNETSWAVIDGTLEIYDATGNLSYRFDIIYTNNNILSLVAKHSDINLPVPYFYLEEYQEEKEEETKDDPTQIIATTTDTPKDENIRLVIWDLDDTFWEGTLAEGAIIPIEKNINIVKELNRRGIVNAICSKNNFNEAKQELEKLGIWDEFVFPKISYNPKGNIVKSIISEMQLRAPTVLFIDDNLVNLNEAKHYIPDLNIAEPVILETLLDNPRFQGKPDPELKRLNNYKVLQEKQKDKVSSGGSNKEFLRNSDIKVSLHYDVENVFPRIHDLVNRTNQLNFTKKRWPEDINEALKEFRNEVNRWTAQAGYVKVTDRYGNYGICGFFMTIEGRCDHFLFSCRTMDMGVEQFVWHQLGRPYVQVQGKVISDIDRPVDWITLVPDADAVSDTSDKTNNLTMCIRGACDLMMTSQFLKDAFKVKDEFNYPYNGWEICSVPCVIPAHDEAQQPLNAAIIKQLPGFPPGRFSSSIVDLDSDVYVLSFSQEVFYGLYRVKSTGMTLPLAHLVLGDHRRYTVDYTKIDYQEIIDRKVQGISPQQWEFLRDNLEFIGSSMNNTELFEKDVRFIFNRLLNANKRIVVIGLNESIGNYKDLLEIFSGINKIVKSLTREFGIPYCDPNTIINSFDDLAADGHFGGTHFSRHVYSTIADEIKKICLAE